jgi:hypothetical protein
MKRDLDLIRSILLDVENWHHPQPIFLEGMTYEGKDKQELDIRSTFWTMPGISMRGSSRAGKALPTYETAAILRMTMAGHEYLDSVRSPEVWKKTKSALEKVGGGAALDVIKEIASKTLAELLKIHTGLQL